LREGAWIRSTGGWTWINEHASWIQRPENARLLGLTDEVHFKLSAIPWDFNGAGREAILRVAMGAGLIRMRGHGASVTFEFTCPTATAIQSVRPFMDQNFGPITWCRFNDLETGQSFGCFYKDLSEAMDNETLSDLLAEAEDSAREDLSLDTRISQEEGEL
jgi:hypothetical protein